MPEIRSSGLGRASIFAHQKFNSFKVVVRILFVVMGDFLKDLETILSGDGAWGAGQFWNF